VVQEEPLYPEAHNFVAKKLESLPQPAVIRDPSLHRFAQYRRETDRQTDTLTMAKTLEAFCCCALKA